MIDTHALQLALRTLVRTLGVASADPGATTNLDEYAASNRDNDGSIGGGIANGQVAQSFELSHAATVASVQFDLSKAGSPTGTITASLYAASGTLGSSAQPTGAPLATSGGVDVTTLTGTPAMTTFTFATPYSIDADTVYCVACAFSGGDGSNYLLVGIRAIGSHAGNISYYDNGLASWSPASAQDAIFVLSGTPVPRISTTSAGYVRDIGSFVTDGFSPGMEVLGAGFSNAANNVRSTVTNVSVLTLTTDATLTTESAASGRTLVVGVPQHQAWENIAFEPTPGTPWIEEQLIPAPTRQISVGGAGTLESRLLYQIQVHVPEDMGVGAANRYCDALMTLFTPGTQITFGSETARVRTDTGPSRGQLLRRRPGWATAPVTFPLEVWSQNTR